MAPRKPRDFSRRVDKREPKKAILIVCEGKRTEPDYFKYLKKELKINPKLVGIRIIDGSVSGNAPISVVRYAKERREEFESIWCVFDVEIQPHPSLAQALNQARDLGFNVALTNPAFEYWLLLHFENTSRPLTSIKQARTELRKQKPLSNFDKSLTDEMMVKVFPLISKAVKHAKQRFRNHAITEIADTNPSTHVYKLVEELQSQGID